MIHNYSSTVSSTRSFTLLFTVRTFIIALTALLSPMSHANSLLEVYQLALTNSPAWLATKSAHLAGKNQSKLGQAGLLPQIQLSAGHSQLDYDSSQTSFLDLDNSRVSGFLNCIDTGLGNVNQCLQENNVLARCGRDTSFQCLFGAVDPNTTFSSTTYGISATQPLFRMDRWFEYRQSQALTRKANLEFEVAYQDFNLRVVEVYFAHLSAQETLEFLRKERESILQLLTATQRAFRRGTASRLDVLEAQSIHDQHQATLLHAETQAENSLENLSQLTGTPITQISPLLASIPLIPPQPNNKGAWVELAKRHNPDIRVAEALAQVANRAHQKARAARLPKLDFNANYQNVDSDGATSTLNQGTTTTTSVGINLTVPLYTGGAISARERSANHERLEADYRRQEVFQITLANTRNHYRSTVSAVRLADAQSTAIESSKSALEAIQRGYQRGTRSVIEVLNAQRNYYQAQRSYAQARMDYLLASLTLKRTAGLMKKADLEIINGLLRGQKPVIKPGSNRGLFN